MLSLSPSALLFQTVRSGSRAVQEGNCLRAGAAVVRTKQGLADPVGHAVFNGPVDRTGIVAAIVYVAEPDFDVCLAAQRAIQEGDRLGACAEAALGSNLSLLTPVVMPFLTAQETAFS